jgi:hypothetical protein
MPIPQTTFGQYSPVAFAGLLYDSAFRDTMSYSAEGAIPFGSFVKLGTNKERQVLAPTTAAGQAALLVGVAEAAASVEQAYPSTGAAAGYIATQSVSMLKDGRIWVNTNDAVVAGAVANFVLANGTVTDEAVAAGIEAFTQLTVKFITGTTAAGLAVVEIAPK